MASYTCPICGYDKLPDRPRTPGWGGSDEMCPSCGFQFGYDDDSEGISDETWRARWISHGMPWSSSGIPKPEGWNPKALLDRLLSAG